MPAHPDILDERESLRGPFLRSLAFHFGVVGIVAAWSIFNLNGRLEHWGDPKSLGGGTVGITPVDKIPLPSREGRINQVANDTESQIPAPAETPAQTDSEAARAGLCRHPEQDGSEKAGTRASLSAALYARAEPETESGVQQHRTGAHLSDVQSGTWRRWSGLGQHQSVRKPARLV